MKRDIVKRFFLPLLIVVLSVQTLYAQTAGGNMQVMSMSSAAHSAGLGLDYLAVYSHDVTVGMDNPSLINSTYPTPWAFNYTNLFAGANFGSVAYAKHINPIGDFLFSLHFNSYGTFEGYDETETTTGTFYAADVMACIGYAFHIDSCFSLGINLKPTLSQYETYTALALAFDVCGSYVSHSHRFATTVMARNLGTQIISYNHSTETLPFTLSWSMSYKLANAPFRVYLSTNELQTWDLRYTDELNPIVVYDPYEGTYTKETWIHRVLDQGFRHIAAGVELSMKEVVFLRVGYNYRQAQEMAGTNNLNLSGFSFGIGFHKRRFSFDYAHRNYHLGQGLNNITLALKL